MYDISFEEANERTLNSHNGEIILVEFNGSHGKSLFKCKEYGHEWMADSWSVWAGNGCPICMPLKLSKKFAFKIEYVREIIENNKCKLISNKYKNSKEKLDVLFECGHQGKISFECFERGVRCAICGNKKRALLQRLSLEEINKRLLEKNLIIVEFLEEYINRNSKITCKCIYGHVETKSISAFLYRNGCTQCSRIKLSLSYSGELGSNWQGGKSSLTSFLKKQIKRWKKDSIKNCNYNCVLCGEGHRFNDVHHLYNFYNIVTDSLSELNLERKNNVFEYSNEELLSIVNKVLEIHYKYPLGICLCRKHHKFFHHEYGLSNNTPQQFEEFKQRIESGELTLPE